MNNIVKLGYAEAVAVTMILMGAKAFLGYPRYMAEAGGTAGWMITLISGLTAILVWLFISRLLERFPGESLVEINEQVLGPVLGLGLNILFLASFLIRSTIQLRLFSETVIITALPSAPISSLAVLFVVPVMFAAYQGLEAISRSSFISLPFVLAGVFAVLVALYPFYDFNYLLPLFGKGVKEILNFGLLGFSNFSEVIILAFFTPYFSFDSRKLKLAGVLSIGLVTGFFLMIIMVYLMVIPMPEAEESLVPFYQLSQSIYLGRFFQRVEAIFVLFWTLTAFLHQAITVITIALVMKQCFKLPYYHPLLPALTTLSLAVALTPKDFITSVQLDRISGIVLGVLVFFILPFAVYVIALTRGKGGEKNSREKI